jgi:hypothetical protein
MYQTLTGMPQRHILSIPPYNEEYEDTVDFIYMINH